MSCETEHFQDLVCKTFYKFWFEEHLGLQTHSFKDGCCVPSEVAKKTEQIVEMLRRIWSHKPLVTVIKRNLALVFFPQSAKAAGINPVLLASVRGRCELMCKCLLEKVLQVTEVARKEKSSYYHVLYYCMPFVWWILLYACQLLILLSLWSPYNHILKVRKNGF